uniref:Uncharacterized protein n=1 Tax=Panagrolaimus superbus TaxID=310955 RepID=A0A914Y0P3_9BILA
MVYFEEGSEENAAEREDKSPLLAFFELCARDENARQFTYQQIPHHYRYDKKKGVWIKRIYNPSKFFVRVHHIPPKMTQLYALRILLMKVQGPTSFKNLKTVNGVEHANFVEAAKALGYWENNDIHFDVINEAIREMRTIKQKKHFLAMVIAHNQPSNANEYIEKFLEPIFHKPPRKFEDVKEQVRFRALSTWDYCT